MGGGAGDGSQQASGRRASQQQRPAEARARGVEETPSCAAEGVGMSQVSG